MPEFVPYNAPLQELVDALLSRKDMQLRILVQEWQWANPVVTSVPRPQTRDTRSLTVAAALVELFALRAGQAPPAWIADAEPLPEPFFVMERAERPGFTRTLCLAEAPEPLRRRNIFAPPNYLSMV
jgi:hypothetical protein